MDELKKKYAIALMLWGCDCHAFEYKPDRQYPTYYQYECGLSNPNLLMIQLFKEGFFREASFYEIFETYTLKDLSVIADSLGIPKRGRKSELIARILEHSTPIELHAHLGNKKFFSLSPKGKAYLRSHHDYVRLHKYNTMQVNLEDYERVKVDLQASDCETVLIHIMKCRIETNRFDELSHLHLKQLYDNIGKKSEALLEFLISLYFRINCLWSFHWLTESLNYLPLEIAKQNTLESAYPRDYITINDAAYFCKNIECFNVEMIDFIYQNYSLKYLIIGKQIFLDILHEIKSQPFFDTEKWNDLIYDQYICILKNI